MRYSHWEIWPIITRQFGQIVTNIAIVAYTYQDQIDWQTGKLEFTFQDAHVVRFISANGGDFLGAETGNWIDPFCEPLDLENASYVERHGKYTYYNMSDSEPYRSFINQPLTAIYPLMSQFNLFAGLRLRFQKHWINVIADADETEIIIGRGSMRLQELGFRIFETE